MDNGTHTPQTPRLNSLKSTPVLKHSPSIENNPSTSNTPNIVTEDSEDGHAPPVALTPRQSGSMVTHHDDVVTRMKNIDLIELGKHRIKPWYFAPYPQVGSTAHFLIPQNLLISMFSIYRKCAARHVYIFVNFV